MASSKPSPKSSLATKKELSTNNYIAAVVTVTLLVVLVCGLIGKSLVNSLIINTKLVAKKAQAKHDLDTKLANIPTLLSNYNNLGNTKQLIADGLPTSADFPQIISIMQGVGTASGVDVRSIAPSTSDSTASGSSSSTSTPSPTPAGTTTPSTGNSTSPTPYIFNVTVAGPYGQIVAFFKNLELSDRPMHVTDTQINGSGGLLSVQATVQTYYQAKADINDTTEQVK